MQEQKERRKSVAMLKPRQRQGRPSNLASSLFSSVVILLKKTANPSSWPVLKLARTSVWNSPLSYKNHSF